MISIRNVSHSIDHTPILHDVSLDIPRGGITALIGPNGAGKSTLLSLVARLAALTTGEISVDTLKIGQCKDRDLAKVLAIMPQSTQVSSRLTIRDLVGFGRYPWHQGHPGPEDREKVEETLTRFGLEPLAHRFLDEISGGQKQRAFAAMAYAQSTPYLLLDEPLNNLDIAASRSLMRLLRDMAEEDGKTILIVLHDINYAAAFADRLVVMKEGRIVADGKPEKVVSAKLLYDVFGTDAPVCMMDERPVVLV
ncbi:ABC transporter ATP-binding protein [Maritimibacter alkaliphilus]|uniref:iron ABC transporter ATP-binding protein n=1 Tax=Maritimibacter alkaliphilus TaxID=404236 RepID=UPI001C950147|nr:ATP-binding cassette domain-containing protein [Maritimibacter alkaliphilus]MBY6092449.1 ATP-binding cassette domain-containing protein [Maritimibacter alkaliphilus]